ncbi:MAG: penicillin-binding protein 1C [Bdellovibrionales bacterium]|nr:penicillin-binding protein 1C [Bdellovibrionales bacterium]
MRRRKLNIILYLMSAAILALIALGLLLTPSFSGVVQLAVGSDRILLSRDGDPLQILRTDFSRRRLGWYPLRLFSDDIRQAVVQAEDQRFFSHIGFDLQSLFRASAALFKGNRAQGASTITMQLSDLIQPDVLISNRRIKKGSWFHKLLQIARAPFLELKWSKSEILEAYLNLIHLRGEFQGVPAASYAFFDKHPVTLDKRESVVLAASISGPNQSFKVLERRACSLIRRIGESSSGRSNDPNSECDSDELRSALELMSQKPKGSIPMPNEAPHLARRLFRDHPTEMIVHSSIDRKLQREVSAILERQIARLQGKNVRDAAAIVVENLSGKVIAYVGAIKSSLSPHVDGIQSPRQAGSTLKPFIYAKALDSRILTSASVLVDDATTISWGGYVYRPINYNRTFYGDVSVREALGSSLNVPAVKVATILGLEKTYGILKSLQFSTLKEADFYGASMVLGAVDVRLDELTNAYRTMANGGAWSDLDFTERKVETENWNNPNAITPRNNDKEKVGGLSPSSTMSKEAAFIVSNILSDANARSIGFGWESPLETSFWTAVKTGTSKDYRDNWCVGSSERYTVGVWTGNFDAQAMDEVSGVSGAAPSWQEIMEHLHKDEPSKAPQLPSSLVTQKIRHHWKSNSQTEFFIKGTEPLAEVIELAPEKRVQFVFPAEGSTLIKDPKISDSRIALYVRFKGEIPENSLLKLNGNILGQAMSPFKIEKPETGHHQMMIISPLGETVAKVNFLIKGG